MLHGDGKLARSNILSKMIKPLREFLSKKNAWTWGYAQDDAFRQVKEELTEPTRLSLYMIPKITADTSSHGLRAVTC